MESLHGFLTAHCNHEPTPYPSQEGNRTADAKRQFPSWEGLGVGWFMGRFPRTCISFIDAQNPRAVAGSAGTLAGERHHEHLAGKGAGAPRTDRRRRNQT